MRVVDCAGVRRVDGRWVWWLQRPAVELLGAEFGLRFLVDPDRPVPGSFRRPPWRGSRKTRRSWCVADRARRNPGSRNRPGWFMDRSDRPPLRIALSARNAFATACNTPQPSYYSKLRHPYLNTRLSSWPISGRSNHASGSSPRDARTRRPAAPTFDWAPGSAAS